MKKPEIKVVHVRTCTMIIDKGTLMKLVKSHAIKEVGFIPEATEFEVRFQDVMEGSPPYRVGTECIVKMTEDQKNLPTG